MEAFKAHEVVPDVINKIPIEQLSVIFKESNVSADFGNELTPTMVKKQPRVEWNADPSSFYTLVMTDPDAPSRSNPSKREWKHWLIVNIPGSKIDEGELKAEYVGAGPPQESGLHRYVLLAFKQKSKQNFSDIHYLSNRNPKRGKFHTMDFAKKHNLELLAGNFFQAQWDDYVPVLYQQFTE